MTVSTIHLFALIKGFSNWVSWKQVSLKIYDSLYPSGFLYCATLVVEIKSLPVPCILICKFQCPPALIPSSTCDFLHPGGYHWTSRSLRSTCIWLLASCLVTEHLSSLMLASPIRIWLEYWRKVKAAWKRAQCPSWGNFSSQL